jgi:hypothetical protein
MFVTWKVDKCRVDNDNAKEEKNGHTGAQWKVQWSDELNKNEMGRLFKYPLSSA